MKKVFLLFVLIKIAPSLFSQGCSDAGVCSIGNMNGSITEKTRITLNCQYGVGEQNVQIFNEQLELLLALNATSSLQCKIPFIQTSGKLGNTVGIGDISAAFLKTYYSKEKWNFRLNAGIKIPLNRADKSFKHTLPLGNTMDLSFPMPYQTSLGTLDILLGTDFTYNKKWVFAIGIQYPIIQNNKNNFDTSLLPANDEAKQYFSSNQLFRRPDLVLRIDKKFVLRKNLNVHAGAIPIYHLGHDRSERLSGGSNAIHGSNGLTFNISTALAYSFKEHFQITFRYSQPLIVRKVRPDGLTRHFVSGLELNYVF